jgi:hypothetical protein
MIDLFKFTQVTRYMLRQRYDFFHADWSNVKDLYDIWKNVTGNPRSYKGEMWAKNWRGWANIVWVYEDEFFGKPVWRSETLVLEHGDFLIKRSAIGTTRQEVLEEGQWLGWLALQEHLVYISGELQEQLS